MDSYLKF